MGFLSDIFGGDSSSSSTSSTSTTSTSASAGASDNSLAISSNAPVTIVEPGSVKAVLDLAGQVNKNALEALSRSFGENIAAVQAGFKENVKLTGDVLNKQTIDSGERLTSLVQTLAWVAAAGALGLFVLKRYA